MNEGASPPDQYPKIKLAIDKTIAQPLSVQVIPLTVDQFRPLGIPFPDGIPLNSLSNPAQCMWRFGSITVINFICCFQTYQMVLRILIIQS